MKAPKKFNSALAMFAIASMMAEGNGPSPFDHEPPITDRFKDPIQGYPVHHKGTRQYFFNAQGQFSNSRMLREDVVFKCIASNPKNAIRKFCKQFKVKPDDCYSLDV